MEDTDWITVNTPRATDRSAKVCVEQKGTGAVLHTLVVGQKGAKRTEEMGMTHGMKEKLILALQGK